MIRIAKFPRLRQLREEKLGWEAVDLAMKLNNRPSVASIYRLEAGRGLRVGNTRRVFDLVNAALGNVLDPAVELEFETHERKTSAEA